MQRYSFRKSFAWIFIAFFYTTTFFSCTVEDHTVPAACRYTGYHQISTSRAGLYNSDIKTKIILDADGRLQGTERSAEQISINSVTQQKEDSSHELGKYSMIYDNNGYLSSMIETHYFVSKRSAPWRYGIFGLYNEIVIERKITTNYHYESGKVMSSSSKTLETLTGDKINKKTTELSSSKIWEYNNSLLAKTVQKNSAGSKLTTTFTGNGGYTISNDSGTEITTYDPQTRIRSYKLLPFVASETIFDENENQISFQSIYQGQVDYTQIKKYDHQKNPERLIPRMFKGIPEPLTTIQTSFGQNNQVEENIVNLVNEKEEISGFKKTYTYNNSGYPVTDSWQFLSAPGNTRTTTYYYENCP